MNLLQKLFQKYLRKFFLTEGRAPGTPKEWMDIQDLAVLEINKTKGVPKKDIPPFQGWKPKIVKKGGIEELLEGPVTSTGPKGTRTWDLSKKKKTGEVIEFPKKKKDDLASGGIARVGMSKGKLAKWLLSLGKKKKPKINRKLTKDELDDLYEEFDEAVPYPMETVRDKEKFLKAVKDEEAYMFQQYKKGNLDPKPGEPNRKRFLEKKLEEMEMSGDKRLMTIDEIEELSSFDLGTQMDIKKGVADVMKDTSEAGLAKSIEIDNLKLEFPGITDEMIENVLTDMNPQRIAEVKQTMREALEMGEKGMGTDEIINTFKESFKRKKQAEGGRASLMYGGDPGFAFEYGGSWADWHDQHRNTMPVEQYIQTKLPKERLPFRQLQSGGLAYMLGEPTYSIGGSVGHAPWLKPTGQPQQQQQGPQPGGAPGGGRPDPMKAPRGLPSLAPRTMDPAVMQQQAMQKMMMGQGQGMMGQGQPRMGMQEGGFTQDDFNRFLEERERRDKGKFKHDFQKDWEDWKRFHEDRTTPVAEGGRIALGLGSMSRRAFLKMMAGITGTGVAAGTGLLKLGKFAPKAIPKVTETIVKGADGAPTYLSDLIEVVKAKGTKDFIEGVKKSDYSTVHSYKNVDVVEDAAGNTKIKKGTETSVYGSDEPGYYENHIEITKGGYVKNKQGKMVKEGDEYFEGTVRPDMDGKMKDIIEEIDEVDHLKLKKIADEIDTLEIEGYDRFSKASGGLAYMLGE